MVWTAPTFADDGRVTSPARVTVLHNGVLIQDDVSLAGETTFIGKPSYRPYTSAPIKLQAHGDPSAPLSFRNIWVRELPDGSEAARGAQPNGRILMSRKATTAPCA